MAIQLGAGYWTCNCTKNCNCAANEDRPVIHPPEDLFCWKCGDSVDDSVEVHPGVQRRIDKRQERLANRDVG
jgi:hypothetical protein